MFESETLNAYLNLLTIYSIQCYCFILLSLLQKLFLTPISYSIISKIELRLFPQVNFY